MSALKAYGSIQKLDASGESPMYRSREWRRQHSSREKWQKQDKWYKKGGYESVIFIAATPNSTLKRQYEREIRSVGLKIKVVESSYVLHSGSSSHYNHAYTKYHPFRRYYR
jgi:hypothetical protein